MSGEVTHCANCGQSVFAAEPHKVGECASPEPAVRERLAYSMTDDRVTLPLTKVRAAAETLCAVVCTDPWTGEVLPGGHDTTCLLPLLAERDLAMATTYLATSISGDCLDPVKHAACSGCACHCHHKSRGPR